MAARIISAELWVREVLLVLVDMYIEDIGVRFGVDLTGEVSLHLGPIIPIKRLQNVKKFALIHDRCS